MPFGKSFQNKKLPNSRDILSHITDMDIYEYYLGSIPTKAISSPFREDKNPSFSLFYSKQYQQVFYKDFATGETGDCFLFVMRLFKIQTKSETFIKIARDFNLNQYELYPNSFHSSPNKKAVTFKSSKKTIQEYKIEIKVKRRNWRSIDKDYWNGKYGLTIKELEYCNIYPISHFFINEKCIVADDLAYVFIEEKDNIQTFKIYQPKADKKNKWFNNNDFSTWELWTQLPKFGKRLIITSSRKDALVIKSLFNSKTLTSCSLQSENVKPKVSVINELKDRFEEIYILYDNDYSSEKNRGRIAGKMLSESTGFKQIEIPSSFKAKDPSDFIEKNSKEKLRSLIIKLIKNKK